MTFIAKDPPLKTPWPMPDPTGTNGEAYPLGAQERARIPALETPELTGYVLSDKAMRFNEGKIRYDLFEPYAMKQLALVFTKGAQKYADRNWEKGMQWSKMLASLERHKAAWQQGEDFDPETGLPHMAHVAWNALGLVSYMKLYPQGDNRQHSYLNTPKIGLDIDEVLCDWVGGWCTKYGMEVPDCWHFDRQLPARFEAMRDTGELDEFMLNLAPKISPKELNFEPHCYVTSRAVPSEITEKWLHIHGFPAKPVYTVGMGESKVEALKKAGVDIFVDDRFENFVELNKAGICTYLLDAKHNRRYDVGYKRIHKLSDILDMK